MANVESASFSAAASPAGAVKGTASSGAVRGAHVGIVCKLLGDLRAELDDVVPVQAPWYSIRDRLEPSALAGDISAECGCFVADSQRLMSVTTSQTLATILIQRGRRLKNTQAERKAHPDTSYQNFFRLSGLSLGKFRILQHGRRGLVFLCPADAALFEPAWNPATSPEATLRHMRLQCARRLPARHLEPLHGEKFLGHPGGPPDRCHR